MRDLKKAALSAAWIAGLLCLGWFLWFLTGNLRARGLERQLNRILLDRGEDFSVTAMPPRRTRRVPLGTEFSLRARNPAETAALSPGSTTAAGPAAGSPGEGTFLAFPLVSGGTALSCGALIDSRGRVERIIPLGAHAEQAFERLAGPVLALYIRRIEGEEPL
jgi:hypothetical protein